MTGHAIIKGRILTQRGPKGAGGRLDRILARGKYALCRLERINPPGKREIRLIDRIGAAPGFLPFAVPGSEFLKRRLVLAWNDRNKE
jgi:hypothetical protein